METNSPGGHGGGSTGGGTSSNITQIGGAAVALGQTDSQHSLPFTLANDQTIGITGSVTATGSITLLAGTAIAGKFGIDQTTDGTTNGVHLVAGTAIAGKVGIDQTTAGTTNGVVMLPSAASGGMSNLYTQMPNNTTPIQVKSSAGTLYAVSVFNNSTTIAYVHFYNSTSPSTGSTSIVDQIMIPAPAAGGGGGVVWSVPLGVYYSTGIAFSVTTGIGSADTTAPAANTYTVTCYYK